MMMNAKALSFFGLLPGQKNNNRGNKTSRFRALVKSCPLAVLGTIWMTQEKMARTNSNRYLRLDKRWGMIISKLHNTFPTLKYPYKDLYVHFSTFSSYGSLAFCVIMP
jgi:hypothetical protein